MRLIIQAKARVTPQTALSVCEQIERAPANVVTRAYAPVISPRVAEILDQAGVGRVDGAGNCRLRSARPPALDRPAGAQCPAALAAGGRGPVLAQVEPHRPGHAERAGQGMEGPRVGGPPGCQGQPGPGRQGQEDPRGRGLRGRARGLLYPRDPVGLLENWAQNYPGPAEQVPMYFLGETGDGRRGGRALVPGQRP